MKLNRKGKLKPLYISPLVQKKKTYIMIQKIIIYDCSKKHNATNYRIVAKEEEEKLNKFICIYGIRIK